MASAKKHTTRIYYCLAWPSKGLYFQTETSNDRPCESLTSSRAFRRACRLCPRPSQQYRHIEEVLVEPGLRADIAETSMAHPGPPNSYQPWHLRSWWSPCSSSSSNPSPAGVDSPDFSTPTSSPPYYSDPAEIGRSFMSLTFPGLQQSCRKLSREHEHHPKGLCLQPRELIRFCICRG